MKPWNDMSVGERIVLSAWVAVREHLLAEQSPAPLNPAPEVTSVPLNPPGPIDASGTLNPGSWVSSSEGCARSDASARVAA
ncbi:MAG: hypothetical protein NZ561_05125 [Phycisphaerae bacterium]|nr:hypothetical protein [Phycisphaerae bacterium]